MADILSIVMLPTYDKTTLAIADASTYDDIGSVNLPLIEIAPPGFDVITIAFEPGHTNIFNSTDLGITTSGAEPLPDGIYCFSYTIGDPVTATAEISSFRVDQLQEKFDEAFMQLDMMECDRAIKMQSKVDLNTIYFFIQGAIAAANNCASVDATKLYIRANAMIDNFINTNCNCSGNNYVINFL